MALRVYIVRLGRAAARARLQHTFICCTLCVCVFVYRCVYAVHPACNNNNNNILYLYTLSREETLFKCVYSGTSLIIMQTKNIINDDKR